MSAPVNRPARKSAMRVFQFHLLAMLCLAVLCAGVPAKAQSLDSLRASGVVGEQFDGFLVLRDSKAPGKVRAMVNDVNAKRRDIYGKRARQQGVSVQQVGQVYAQQIMQKAPKGTWFRSQGGSWVRK